MNGEQRTSDYFDGPVRRDAIPGLDLTSIRHLFRDGGGRFRRLPVSTRFVATQPTVTDWIVDRYVADPYARPGLSPCRDLYPVLVDVGGRLHIADGHHRLVAAIRRGDAWVECWVARLDAREGPSLALHATIGAKWRPDESGSHGRNLTRALNASPARGGREPP